MHSMILIGAASAVLGSLFAGFSMAANERREAIFGGGCFWCMEPPFEQVEGVLEVIAGYSGGKEVNPRYEQVASGQTGHVEAVRVTYDPALVSYRELLEVYWRQINPTDAGGQFADRGKHYRTVIFYVDDEQRRTAEQSRDELQQSGVFDAPVVTAIEPATAFYPAEEYHQDYYKKNVLHYNAYKEGSGRAGFLENTWKNVEKKQSYVKPDETELRQRLSSCQFDVTQNNGTEPPFANEFWDSKREGLYVDVVSGEPLFSSRDKYDSGSGWPSFTRPVNKEQVVEKTDSTHGMRRTEVRSRQANSHLGHVFDDGPAPTGLRYCINSAALRFIPVDDLDREGYGDYRRLFP